MPSIHIHVTVVQLPEAHRCFGQLRSVAANALGRWLALPPDVAGGPLVPLPAPLETAFAADITSVLAPKAQVGQMILPARCWSAAAVGAGTVRR